MIPEGEGMNSSGRLVTGAIKTEEEGRDVSIDDGGGGRALCWESRGLMGPH